MDARAMFVMQQDFVSAGLHGAVLSGLTPDDIRAHPVSQNSVVWLVWHAARWQDVIAASWIAEEPQVFDSHGFADRTLSPTRVVGTGMTFDEAVALSQAVDIDAVLSYWDAVAANTARIAQGLTPQDLDRTIDDSCKSANVADGTFKNERSPWLDQFLAVRRSAGTSCFFRSI